MTPPTWAPTVADVGAILRARTQQALEDGGGEAGTFNANTRPTATEVQALIEQACADVTADLGTTTLGARCEPLAARATALSAAMLVELSYFPEQVASDHSPYDRLAEQQKLAAGRLERCVGSSSSDNEGEPARTGMMPRFTYPPALPAVPGESIAGTRLDRDY